MMLHVSRRFLSSALNKPFVRSTVNDKTGIAVVTLQKAPVNSMSYEFMVELTNTLDILEKDKCRGMILTSSLNKVFCAGLELTSLYQPGREQFWNFWASLQDLWAKLYYTPFTTVAAINGHAPAGGCLLSLATEYRVMVKNYTIGLNETKVGIPVPKWLCHNMQEVIGIRNAEISLTAGTMFTSEEAYNIGLVDELVDDADTALQKAEEFLNRFSRISPMARTETKKRLRSRLVDDLKNYREKEIQFYVDFMLKDEIQQKIGNYLENIRNKSKK